MDDINISLDELNTIDLSPLIQSKLPVTCFDITKYLSSLGDGRAEIRLLTHICGFHFRPENPQVHLVRAFKAAKVDLQFRMTLTGCRWRYFLNFARR